MKLKIYTIFIAFFLMCAVKGQQHQRVIKVNSDLSNTTIDSITFQSFAKMATGSESVSNLSNSMTFVPTDGKFTLNVNTFFRPDSNHYEKPGKLDWLKPGALSFNGSGSLVGGNIATLFKGGKLNTGVDLGVKVNWRLNKQWVGYNDENARTIGDRKNELANKIEHKIDSVRSRLHYAELWHKRNLLKLRAAEKGRDELIIAKDTLKCQFKKNKKALKSTIDSLGTLGRRSDQKIIDSLLALLEKTTLTTIDSNLTLEAKILESDANIRKLLVDTVKSYETTILAKVTKRTATAQEIDILTKYGVQQDTSYEAYMIKALKRENDAGVYQIEKDVSGIGFDVNWLSLVGAWNRQSYRTYYSTLPFGDALTKHDFDGYTIGLQSNFYHLNTTFKNVHLFNIALLYKRTNNLEDFSTSKLTEETSVSESGTTRKGSDEYNVYTDTVDHFHTWQVPVNFYYFFGSDLKFGIHGYAQSDWRVHAKDLYDAGIGFIFGLNSTSTSRLFNIELFATYKDIGRAYVEEDTTRWEQVQVGLSVNLPLFVTK